MHSRKRKHQESLPSVERSKEQESFTLHRMEITNQELLKLNDELHCARDQAIDASNMKSAFVANISHELRTPLAGVIGLNEILLETDLTSEQQSLARSVQDCARALLAIVSDILDLSKMEAGKTILQSIPFDSIFLAQEICTLLEETAKRKGLSLHLFAARQIPRFVVGDPVRFRQVLLNLVGNAIKFTSSGEVSIHASLESESQESATLCFSVKDTGIGIADSERRFLFQPFSQVDNSNTRKYGGTGLGLSITKRLVLLMGGEIGVDSEKGKGSTFWFKIPFCKEKRSFISEGPDNIQSSTEGLPADLNVLVVEDNALIQKIAIKQLTILHIHSTAVSNGREALEAIGVCHYDAVLMDCQMPEMDGFEATTTIRSMEIGTNTRSVIIAMTASAMASDRARCISCGMDDFLSKPMTIEQLRSKLLKWFAVDRALLRTDKH